MQRLPVPRSAAAGGRSHSSRAVETHVAIARSALQPTSQPTPEPASEAFDNLTAWERELSPSHIAEGWREFQLHTAHQLFQDAASAGPRGAPGTERLTYAGAYRSPGYITEIEAPARHYQQAKDLLNQIKATTTWPQLQAMYTAAPSTLSHVHLASLFTHLANIAPCSRAPPRAAAHPPELSRLANAILSQCLATYLRYPPKTRCNLFWGACQLIQAISPANLRGIVLSMEHSLPDLTPHDLAAVAWCAAKSSLPASSISPTWDSTFFSTSLPALPSFTPQNLANTIWALAIMGIPPPPAWLAAFYAVALHTLPSWHPNQFGNVAWSLATLNLTPDPAWLDAFIACAAAHLHHFPPSHLKDTLMALSTWESASSSPLMASLLAAAELNIPHLTPWGVVDFARCLENLGYSGRVPDPFLQAILAHALSESPRYPPAALPVLLTTLDALGCPPPPAWIAQLLGRLRPSALPRKDGVDLLRVLARLQVRPGSAWLGAFFAHLAPDLAAASTRSLVALSLICSQLLYNPGEAFLGAYFLTLQLRLSHSEAPPRGSGGRSSVVAFSRSTPPFRTRDAARRAAAEHAPLTPSDVATILNSVTQFVPGAAASAWLQPVLLHAARRALLHSGRDCAAVLRAAAEADAAREAAAEPAKQQGAMACSGISSDEFVGPFMQRVSVLGPEMSTTDLCLAVGSLSRLRPRDEAVAAAAMQLLVQRLQRHPQTRGVGDVARLLAVAMCPALRRAVPPGLAKSVGSVWMGELRDAEPKDMVQLMRSCHQLGYDFRAGRLGAVVVEEMVDRAERGKGVGARQLLELMTAAGEVEMRLSRGTMFRLASVLRPHAPAMAPSDAARCLWSFGRLGCLPTEPLTLQLVYRFSATFASDPLPLPSADASLAWDPSDPSDPTSSPPSPHQTEQPATPTLSQATSPPPPRSAPPHTPEHAADAAKVLWALAITAAPLPPRPILAPIIAHMEHNLPLIKPNLLADGLWAATKLGYHPAPPSLAAILATTEPLLPRLSPGGLARVLYVAAYWDARPPGAWLHAAAHALLAVLPHMHFKVLAITIYALARMEGVGDARVVRQLGQRLEAVAAEDPGSLWAQRLREKLVILEALAQLRR